MFEQKKCTRLLNKCIKKSLQLDQKDKKWKSHNHFDSDETEHTQCWLLSFFSTYNSIVPFQIVDTLESDTTEDLYCWGIDSCKHMTGVAEGCFSTSTYRELPDSVEVIQQH